MTDHSRRGFLKHGLLLGGAALGMQPLTALAERLQAGGANQLVDGFGPLLPTIDATTGLPLLQLPAGFRYLTFGWTGSKMDDGYATPADHDGMGVVATDGDRTTLVRNHELRGSTVFGNPRDAYDSCGGGTTTVVFDAGCERMVGSWSSLVGTLNNCAGGATPWGTWLSCEEAVFDPGPAQQYRPEMVQRYGLEKLTRQHGYVFEVPATGVAKPEPIVDMGQFYHEAVAIDPDSNIAYLTEDYRPFAGFYRYLPNKPGQLSAGGKLQMMQVVDHPDMRRYGTLNETLAVKWVDIADPNLGNSPGTHDAGGVVRQGIAAGASSFVALEGCACHNGMVYFTSKLGGGPNAGQIFCYDPKADSLQLVFESPGHSVFSGPDNIIPSPRGGLLVCEDRVAEPTLSQRLMGLTANGDYFYFSAVNPALTDAYLGHELAGSATHSEWAGVCFSADGKWLFANLMYPGFTVAITGPWQQGLI